LESQRVKAHEPAGIALTQISQQGIKGSATLAELLRRSTLSYEVLEQQGLGDDQLAPEVKEAAEIAVKYSGYIQRQTQQIQQVTKHYQRPLPQDLDYHAISTLSKESREKLATIKPLTLGQAARIGGVSPADINALLIYLELQRHRSPQAEILSSGTRSA
jgi:tRNA uridine 5-carboxymethylaminomethyl modification enzyme